MNVSLIVVNYFSKDETLNLIKSANFVKVFDDFEIIVVDNSNEKEFFENQNIKYLNSGKNLGYGGGINFGSNYAEGKYLFFLNPDVEFIEPLDGLLNYFNQKTIASCPLMVPHKNFQLRKLPSLFYFSYDFLGFSNFFPNFFITKKYFYEPLPKEPFEVEQPAGAAILIEKEKFFEIGKFDEDFYPLYFEDVDLSYRIKEKGYKIICVPDLKVKHKIGLSAEKMGREEFLKIYTKNALKYFKKRNKKIFFYKIIISLGIFLRALKGNVPFKLLKEI
jgi:GT2 family glycosyltransferase